MDLSIISGNIGKDAVEKTTQGGKPYIGFSVGVNQSKKNADGTWDNQVKWVNCACYMKTDVSRLTKGTTVIVHGKPEASIYEGKIQHSMIVNFVEVVAKPKAYAEQTTQSPSTKDDFQGGGDDLPF